MRTEPRGVILPPARLSRLERWIDLFGCYSAVLVLAACWLLLPYRETQGFFRLATFLGVAYATLLTLVPGLQARVYRARVWFSRQISDVRSSD